MDVAKRVLGERGGQMTVEFVVAFPVMLIIAVISINAILFFSECASFDRLARQCICVHAASPGYGQGRDQVVAAIQGELDESFDGEWLGVEVSASASSMGHVRYTAILSFQPTLAGRAFSRNVFGASISPLRHQVSMVIDPYRPGVIA